MSWLFPTRLLFAHVDPQIMATEQTPLLASEAAAEADHNLIYDRYSPRRKGTIVALIAWACFIPCTSFWLYVRV